MAAAAAAAGVVVVVVAARVVAVAVLAVLEDFAADCAGCVVLERV